VTSEFWFSFLFWVKFVVPKGLYLKEKPSNLRELWRERPRFEPGDLRSTKAGALPTAANNHHFKFMLEMFSLTVCKVVINLFCLQAWIYFLLKFHSMPFLAFV